MRATAEANPNIALIKYWGKADVALNLPVTGSLSLTLDAAPTRTTVALDAGLDADEVVLGGAVLSGRPAQRVERFLDLVRAASGRTEHARVDSVNLIPTGAGLASSASGFAALAAAAAAAYGLDLDGRALSRLARRGSGSASRSIFGGIVRWHPGDDAASFAEPVDAPGLDLAMVVAIIAAGPKSISSTEAMNRTTATSPFYAGWAESTPRQLDEMLEAIAYADFTAVGELTESNSLRMHATMAAAWPPVRYPTAASVALLDATRDLRADGIEAYATMDAGPNVKVLCRPADAARVEARLAEVDPTADFLSARAGESVRLIDEPAA
ncbi:diphosphomevalonate decarboxylase [Agromyces atrinae]|uniref:diphosphomevalonate decarboxylase n=1 Tax=Agromyces atrinae TaxID=592376 RepID=UPI001F58747E|nr:diphosphomevalonate decarboxylase [Agromyces atrinae]MCI2957418.1 diphosphomevalonate decarboxylase [Agromyces atrinae]